jgi:uncharacterized protein (TIGR02453 family)
MTFRGFPVEALRFYDGLEADNSRDYWQAYKAVYEASVKAPMLALLDEVPDRYKPFHLFRPNRDVRFSSDKSPYKTATGAVGESEGGSIYYVQFSAQGLMAAAGYYQMANDQLERFRTVVDDDTTGPEVATIVAALVRKGYTPGAISELKTAPRGYPRDHPRIELLRRKGLMVAKSFAPAAWLHTAAARKKVEQTWADAAPLCRWLDAHVGPSELPPEDDRWVR